MFIYRRVFYHLLKLALSNWKTHGEIYLTKCKALKIQPNAAALPSNTEANPEDKRLAQPSLDQFLKTKWSKEGLLEYIVNFIVQSGQVNLFSSVYIFA